jgi:hypothetical protein
MKTANLICYMKKRANFEGVEWEIPDEYLENFFVQKGTRIFFGVVLDDLGNILEDKKFPEFYNNFKKDSDAA